MVGQIWNMGHCLLISALNNAVLQGLREKIFKMKPEEREEAGIPSRVDRMC